MKRPTKPMLDSVKRFIIIQLDCLFQSSDLKEKDEIRNRFSMFVSSINNLEILNSITDQIFDIDETCPDGILLLENIILECEKQAATV
ncbi:hypothetical protein D0469_18080 [Peribacillus saganii]|uniref:Uncharacterized protein n=1 Tax=Peribacillus saganii TaxID=2303992 RepID=A0A372LE06_9BACI|nr:hypothetical protein [Peribacillus saganii]RFU64472.1 hypothetical protein D0469_18080 [Peribacillus saganii]